MIAPDGTWLATIDDGGGGAALIWDLATSQVNTLHPRRIPGPTMAAIAPDGTWLATAGPYGPVRIWDPVGGEQTALLVGHSGCVKALAISPDSSWLATADDEDHGMAGVWDPATDQQTAILTGHTGTGGSGRGWSLSTVRVWLR